MKTPKKIRYEVAITILLAMIYVCIQTSTAEESRINKEAKTTQSKKDMVKDVTGRITMETFDSDRGVIVSDIKELTRRSTEIIIGRPLANKSFYDEKRDEARTLHLLQVQTVFKGHIENGSSIELEIPGGGYIGRDGKAHHRRASDARALRENVSYFIFMRENTEGKKNVYRPAFGVQGIFEMNPEVNTVLPCDLVKSDPVVKKYENASIADFMDELMTAISTEVSRRQ